MLRVQSFLLLLRYFIPRPLVLQPLLLIQVSLLRTAEAGVSLKLRGLVTKVLAQITTAVSQLRLRQVVPHHDSLQVATLCATAGRSLAAREVKSGSVSPDILIGFRCENVSAFLHRVLTGVIVLSKVVFERLLFVAHAQLIEYLEGLFIMPQG